MLAFRHGFNVLQPLLDEVAHPAVLGETGRLSDMLWAFEAARTHLEKLSHPTLWPTCPLSLFAVAGREAAVAGLVEGLLAGLTPGAKASWRSTRAGARNFPDDRDFWNESHGARLFIIPEFLHREG